MSRKIDPESLERMKRGYWADEVKRVALNYYVDDYEMLPVMLYEKDFFKRVGELIRDMERIYEGARHDARAKAIIAEQEVATIRRSYMRGRLLLKDIRARIAQHTMRDTRDGNLKTEGWFVYFLLDQNGTVLYVGSSGNLFSRLGTHLTNNKTRYNGRITHVRYIECPDQEDMVRQELRFIYDLQPEFNTQGR